MLYIYCENIDLYDISVLFIIQFYVNPLIDCFIYRTFGVVNPTNKGYSFEWICEDRNDDTTKVSPFKCVTMEGLIKSGKRFPVSFIKHLNR